MDAVPIMAQFMGGNAVWLTLAHFAAALTVSIHTLRFKRDVRAAIGWIGLAWLAPFFGALFYLGFGINRVKRKAQRLMGREAIAISPKDQRETRADPLEALKAAVGTVSGRDLVTVNSVDILDSGDEAYPAMLAAIGQAQTSVALSTYIFEMDKAGSAFVKALSEAHRRGVAVSVLIDGFGGDFLTSPAYHALLREGVPVARFLHSTLPWKMPLLNLRLHKKALILDERIAFVGGLNIAEDNLRRENPKTPVRDTHFRLTGEIVRQIADDFREDWRFTTDTSLPAPASSGSSDAPACGTARAIDSGPDQEYDHLVLVLLSAISAARTSIKILTPYFLPDEQLVTALQIAVYRGVSVDIVIPKVNNHPLVAWACRPHLRPILEAGGKVWESPPPFDHSKLATIDDEWSLIGSANWDARSLRLNFELTIELYDPALARRLSGLIGTKCASPVTLKEIDGRWPLTKLRDAAARLLMPYL